MFHPIPIDITRICPIFQRNHTLFPTKVHLHSQSSFPLFLIYSYTGELSFLPADYLRLRIFRSLGSYPSSLPTIFDSVFFAHWGVIFPPYRLSSTISDFTHHLSASLRSFLR